MPVINPATEQVITAVADASVIDADRAVEAAAAASARKCQGHLAWRPPFIVCEDADLDVAVKAAFDAKMRNMGEACTGANRFFVHEAVAADFAARLDQRMSPLTVGNDMAAGVNVGPMIDQAACAEGEASAA
jgi:succinate-semialdehyde dehydrogenase/glutarate-semialdehyde dehydrogenase